MEHTHVDLEMSALSDVKAPARGVEVYLRFATLLAFLFTNVSLQEETAKACRHNAVLVPVVT